MVEISKSGSGEGPGKVTTRGYSTTRFRGRLSTKLGCPGNQVTKGVPETPLRYTSPFDPD
jgi:hypothetical protein